MSKLGGAVLQRIALVGSVVVLLASARFSVAHAAATKDLGP